MSAGAKEVRMLAEIVGAMKSQKEREQFLRDLLTDPELEALSERWNTICALLEGGTHRAVRDAVGVSIAKVTHAANLLKKGGDGFRLAYKRWKAE